MALIGTRSLYFFELPVANGAYRNPVTIFF
jgi:hypothetical protein